MGKIKRIVEENGGNRDSRISGIDVKEIYTPLSVAKEEIWRRWNDKALRKKACPSTNF